MYRLKNPSVVRSIKKFSFCKDSYKYNRKQLARSTKSRKIIVVKTQETKSKVGRTDGHIGKMREPKGYKHKLTETREQGQRPNTQVTRHR